MRTLACHEHFENRAVAMNPLPFIPFNSDTNKYYLFYIGFVYPSSILKLMYSIIDFSNNSAGVVIEKNIILIDSVSENLFAVRHGNGRDWWLICLKNYSNIIYKTFVSDDNISIQNQQIGRNPGRESFGELQTEHSDSQTSCLPEYSDGLHFIWYFKHSSSSINREVYCKCI